MYESFDKERLKDQIRSLDAARVRLQSEIDNVLNNQRPSHHRLQVLIKDMMKVTNEMNRIAGWEGAVYEFTG